MRLGAAFLFSVVSSSFELKAAQSKLIKSPEILVLGDSQLSFGSGPVILDFFKNIKSHCGNVVQQPLRLEEIEKKRTTLVGVRSSSLRSWITRRGHAWNAMCRKDKTWGVNASIWGYQQKRKQHYVQIGEGRKYQFCRKGKTPLEAMMAKGYYRPELVMFYLLGNGASRWAGNLRAAKLDIKRMIEQLPSGTQCIYMTTMPNYKKRINKIRLRAQAHLEHAFAAHGKRCTFIRGLTPKILSIVQGQNQYFHRKESGKVKDPFHPSAGAAEKVLALKKTELCHTIADKLRTRVVSKANIDIGSQ